jgi:Flp pilus assembly protein CpaB
MTRTADRLASSTDPVSVEPVPRRPLVARLSVAHVVMILAGLLAFLLVLVVLRERGETLQIAVTVEQIDAGTSLQRSDIRFATLSDADEELLRTFLTPGEFAAVVDEGWIASRTIAAGVALSANDFRSEATSSSYRAMSLPVASAHAVNGAIVAGDRVDVIAVDRGIAAYVAVDVEVIAVSAATSSTRSGFALTVAVDDSTSLRLAAAINSAAIEVVRSTGAVKADAEATFPPVTGDEAADGG